MSDEPEDRSWIEGVVEDNRKMGNQIAALQTALFKKDRAHKEQLREVRDTYERQIAALEDTNLIELDDIIPTRGFWEGLNEVQPRRYSESELL